MAASGEADDPYLSLTDDDNSWTPAPSSVDSEELQELLEELQIVPAPSKRPAAGKRPLAPDSPPGALSPSASRPLASPRLHGSHRGPAGAAAGGQPPQLPPQAVQAAEPEFVDLLDSSNSDSEEEWSIPAPSTAQKRWGRSSARREAAINSPTTPRKRAPAGLSSAARATMRTRLRRRYPALRQSCRPSLPRFLPCRQHRLPGSPQQHRAPARLHSSTQRRHRHDARRPPTAATAPRLPPGSRSSARSWQRSCLSSSTARCLRAGCRQGLLFNGTRGCSRPRG